MANYETLHVQATRSRADCSSMESHTSLSTALVPRLIMILIIIKTKILFFIQTIHTDDFPSMGTRLVIIIIITCGRLNVLCIARALDHLVGVGPR